MQCVFGFSLRSYATRTRGQSCRIRGASALRFYQTPSVVTNTRAKWIMSDSCEHKTINFSNRTLLQEVRLFSSYAVSIWILLLSDQVKICSGYEEGALPAVKVGRPGSSLGRALNLWAYLDCFSTDYMCSTPFYWQVNTVSYEIHETRSIQKTLVFLRNLTYNFHAHFTSP
jgi:hypothetical protein